MSAKHYHYTHYQLDNTLVYPHLIYAITIWGTDKTTAIYMLTIHRLHKRIIRIITKSSPHAHTKPLFQQLRILTIFQLYIYRTILPMHSAIYPQPSKPHKKPIGRAPLPEHRPYHNAQYKTLKQTHQHSTRLSTQHPHLLHHTHKTSHSTSRASIVWNKLPNHITSITNYTTFKKTLLNHLLSEQ